MLGLGDITEGPVVPARSVKKAKPVTVCEALAGRESLSGKPAAIVGRIECGGSLDSDGCFLTEDNCKHPVTSDGNTWPDKVLILDYWEDEMPRPPQLTPEIDKRTLANKLSLVRSRTTINDDWGVAYGVIFTAHNPQNRVFEGAPIAIVCTPNGARVRRAHQSAKRIASR